MNKLILPVLLLVSSQMFALEVEFNASSRRVEAFQVNGQRFDIGHILDERYKTPKCERLDKILKSGVFSFDGYYFKNEKLPKIFKMPIVVKLDNVEFIDIEDFDYKKLGTNKPAVKLEIKYEDKKVIKDRVKLELLPIVAVK